MGRLPGGGALQDDDKRIRVSYYGHLEESLRISSKWQKKRMQMPEYKEARAHS